MRTRSRKFLAGIVAMAACGALVAPAFAQVAEMTSETVPGVFDAAKTAADQQEMAAWLLAEEGKEKARGMVVEPKAEDLDRLKGASAASGRLLVGFTNTLGAEVRFEGIDTDRLQKSVLSHGEGVLRLTSDGFVWHTTIESRGAAATRLHLTDFSLPAGAELYVYSGREAFGPYTGKGVMGDGEFWTHTLVGSKIHLQLRYKGGDVAQAFRSSQFDIMNVGHMGDGFVLASWLNPDASAQKAFCSFNEGCVQNASCSSIPSAIQPAANAVAHLQYVVGSSAFICSGGLLNDTDSSSTIPYFLTANHCFDTQASASSLEAYFQFTTSCGGNCFNPDGAVPRVLGSTLLATNATSDYTFLQLNGTPAGATLLGWSTTAVANSNGTSLFRISHPKGAPQAYSTHSVSTSAGTCGGIPRGSWIYSNDTFGASEGGSSGSVVLNSAGQVVGQLTGACGPNPSVACDAANATIDGALAAYFSSVSQWLDPPTGGGGCHVGSNGDASFCSASCPCDDGEGDCDSNAECTNGTTCVDNVGPNYGFASWVDVCEAPSNCHVGALGSASYCSSGCPCDAGEGDCDSNAECASGTTCVDNVGPNYGFASWVDVCEGSGGGSNPNSCVGNCGGQAPGGCWCDSQCANFGDCCSDKVGVCG